MKDLTVIVPVFNEEASIEALLVNIKEKIVPTGASIIFVNDGSTDNSKALLKVEVSKQISLVNHKVNRGYGGAIKSGILASKTPYVITFDADNQHDINDIPKLYEQIKIQDADMVVGKRKSYRESNFKRLGKWIIRRLVNTLFPLKVSDINSGIKIYRSDIAVKNLEFCPDSMAFSDVILLMFVSQRHLVTEMEVTCFERNSGQSKVGLNSAINTFFEILSVVLLFNPLKIFLPVSFICFLFGSIWGAFMIMQGNGLSVAALLALLISVLLLLIGLVANQLRNISKALINFKV